MFNMENIQDLIKELVAQAIAEKKLTAAEKRKKEDIVMAMKKDFKGPKSAMYAIATEKAKKLAETDIEEARFKKGEDVGKPGKGFEKIVKSAAKQYGSKEAGAKVAGAILKKVVKEDEIDEAYKIDFDDKGNIIRTPAKDAPKQPSSGDVEIPKLDKVEPLRKKKLAEDKKTLWWVMIEKDGKRFYLKNSPYFSSEQEAHDYAKKHNVKNYSLKSREENVDDDGRIIENNSQELDEFMIRRWQYYAGIK